ncbi:MAG: zinc ribbon domain-containing protein [Lachnospiraceae bacterium]|nr:zinc ribbon domain-containing protein [Lachnospiraceae bacterium]
MVCKGCKHWNYDNAKFCYYCGGELYGDTTVSVNVGNSVAAYSAPTVGVRSFMGVGNYALQTAYINRRNEGKPDNGYLAQFSTNSKVKTLGNGDWFCPDCGEPNEHNERTCRGCGRYK